MTAVLTEVPEIIGIDKAALLRFLMRDRLAAAYPIGDLDPRFSDFCRWWGHSGTDGELDGILLLYTGLRSPVVLTLGSGDAVERLLAQAAPELPTRFYAHVMGDHVGALEHGWAARRLRPMVRMGLSRSAFIAPSEDLRGVVPVTHQDTSELALLYRFYPDNFFEPYQLESGYYYGVREGGHLVSVAGVHVYSRAHDIAAIGNVVTHPEHRSKGHSRRCTARLCQALFETVSLVALNVDRENVAARRIYQRLGFTDHLEYLEGFVETR